MERITVQEAAQRMGVTPMFLRLCLREDKLPFGTAIKFDKQWSYHINPARFEIWMNGEDLKERSG